MLVVEKEDGARENFIVSRLYLALKATLMLSFGKLMKMCGVFISCESLTNRNIIAPFSAVLVSHFFFRSERDEKPLSYQADSFVRSSPFFRNDSMTASDE